MAGEAASFELGRIRAQLQSLFLQPNAPRMLNPARVERDVLALVEFLLPCAANMLRPCLMPAFDGALSAPPPFSGRAHPGAYRIP